MAVPGRKPREDRSTIRHRVPPVHEWTEVENVPYDSAPELPARMVITPDGREIEARWPPATRRWWAGISRMPHCRLWTETDWQYAMDTAEVHARWTVGLTAATELRIREKRMGNTLDARRDLRIRYVPAKQPAPEGAAAEVVQMDSYRDLYG